MTISDLFKQAARGDLDALRGLRDDILEQGVGDRNDTLAQAELVAWMAAEVGGPMDKLALASVLFLRAHDQRDKRDAAMIERLRHVGLKDDDEAAHWQVMADENAGRMERYEEQAASLFPAIASGDDPDAAAMLISALTQRADGGDDEALGTIQRLIDAMPLSNLGAVKAAILNLEQEQAA